MLTKSNYCKSGLTLAKKYKIYKMVKLNLFKII